MTSARGPFHLGAFAAGLSLLAGCAQSPPTRFFTLDALAPSAPSTAAGPLIRVDHVTVPAVMDRPEMVREQGGERLKVDDFSHWGAPLGDLMRAALVEDLTARSPTGRVLPAGSPKVSDEADIVVEVAAVHERPGAVVLEVNWTMIEPSSGAPGQAPIASLARHASIEAPLNGASQQAFADALSHATATLSDHIVLVLSGLH